MEDKAKYFYSKVDCSGRINQIRIIVTALLLTIGIEFDINFIQRKEETVLSINHPLSLMLFPIFVLFYIFLSVAQKYYKQRYRLSTFITGYIFSAIYLVGLSYYIQGDLSIFTNNILIFSIRFLILGYFITMMLHCIYVKIFEYTINGEIGNLNKRIIIFLFFICYIPYVIWLYPGIVSWDCVTMIRHVWQLDANGINNTSNPPFQTLLFCIPIAIADHFGSERLGVAFFDIVQVVITIFVFCISIYVLEKMGMKKKILVLTVGIWILLPIYPMYANSICKDSLFSSFMLLYCALLLYIIRFEDEFFSSKKKMGLMFLTIIMVSLLRNNSIYIALVTCLIVILKLLNKYRTKWFLICSLAFIISGSFLFWAQEIKGENVPDHEKLAVYYQQTARYTYYYGDEQSEREKEIINRVLSYDKLKETYVEYWAEPVMGLRNKDATDEDRVEYMKIWRYEFRQHPLCYINATLANSYAYFYPCQLSLFDVFQYNDPASYTKLDGRFEFGFRERRDIKDFEAFFEKAPLLWLFTTCGFYICLFIFSVGYLIRKKDFIIALFPEIICLIACFFLPANGNFRYILSIVYTAPFFLALCFSKQN